MKKFTAIMLAVLMLLSICAPVGAVGGAKFILADATIEAGETANVVVNLQDSPGIAAATVKFSYDKSVLSITKASKSGSVFDTVTLGQVSYGSKIVVDAEEDVEGDGKVATLTIAVDANAAPGTYEITVSSTDCNNYDLDDVAVATTVATITVPGATPAANASFVLADATIEAGQTANVVVNLQDSPGIAAATVKFAYDKSALSITKASKSGSVFDTVTLGQVSYGSKLVVDAEEDVEGDGKVATLTIAVDANATPGTYQIVVSSDDCNNYDLDDVAVDSTTATITVTAPPVHYDGTTFVLADATITAGTSANVQLDLVNEPQAGIAAATVKFTYDKSVFSFTKASKTGSIFDTVTLGQVSYGSKLVVDAEDDVLEGKVATLTIAVPANAVNGVYDIVVSSTDCNNYDLDDVAIDSMTAKITVVGGIDGPVGPSEAAQNVINAIAALPAAASITVDDAAQIQAARAAYAALSAADQADVSNYATLEAAEAALAVAIAAAERAARIANVEGLIAAIGTVTLDSEDAIIAAETALAALAADEAREVENASVLTDARATYDALVAARAARIAAVEDAIDAIGTVTLDSGDAIVAAEAALAALAADEADEVSNAADLATARATYDALVAAAARAARIANVEALIDAIGTVTRDSEDAIIAAETALAALAADEAKDVANADALITARATYDALVTAAEEVEDVTVSIGATVTTGDDIAPALYFPISEESADFVSVVINGVETELSAAEVTANGIKVPVGAFAAKNMGDAITYEIKVDGEVVASASTSVKAYAEALATTPGYEEVGTSMLAYGAAAQTYFGHDTDNLISDVVITDPVVGEKFDATAIKAQMNADASIPVVYNAMNVTFLDEVVLNLAFKVKAGFTKADAAAWVEENITFGGAPAVAEIRGNFIVISKANIAISEVMTPNALVVAGETYYVSVLNYLAAVEESGTMSDSMKNLARAFYAYVNAMNSIG